MTITIDNTTTKRRDGEVVVSVGPSNASQLLGGLVLLAYEQIDTIILDNGAVRVSRVRGAVSHKRAAVGDEVGTFIDNGGKVEFVLTLDDLGYVVKTIAEYCYQGFGADHIHIACDAAGGAGEVELTFVLDNPR